MFGPVSASGLFIVGASGLFIMCGNGQRISLADCSAVLRAFSRLTCAELVPALDTLVQQGHPVERIPGSKTKSAEPMKNHDVFEQKSWKNGSRRACSEVAIRLRRPLLSAPPILWRTVSGRIIADNLKTPPG
jgi:hypothetical protein